MSEEELDFATYYNFLSDNLRQKSMQLDNKSDDLLELLEYCLDSEIEVEFDTQLCEKFGNLLEDMEKTLNLIMEVEKKIKLNLPINDRCKFDKIGLN